MSDYTGDGLRIPAVGGLKDRVVPAAKPGVQKRRRVVVAHQPQVQKQPARAAFAIGKRVNGHERGMRGRADLNRRYHL